MASQVWKMLQETKCKPRKAGVEHKILYPPQCRSRSQVIPLKSLDLDFRKS